LTVNPMKKLSEVPNDILLLVFECLPCYDLNGCSYVCHLWHLYIKQNCVLEARANIRKAIGIFNEKAELGIDFMTKSIAMIPDTKEGIAKFLTHPSIFPHLSRREIGRYLGQKQNKDTFYQVLTAHDYCGLHLDEALRKFFMTFQPMVTTSSLKVMLRTFAIRFCECNPHYFCESPADAVETAYLLCFAMLMLNTDAHNSTVINKMTRQQFVAYIFSSLNLKININYLEGIYNRIVSQEITTNDCSKHSSLSMVRSAIRWASYVL
jgi:Sec7-like guanine-nucleotide exchange factor